MNFMNNLLCREVIYRNNHCFVLLRTIHSSLHNPREWNTTTIIESQRSQKSCVNVTGKINTFSELIDGRVIEITGEIIVICILVEREIFMQIVAFEEIVFVNHLRGNQCKFTWFSKGMFLLFLLKNEGKGNAKINIIILPCLRWKSFWKSLFETSRVTSLEIFFFSPQETTKGES